MKYVTPALRQFYRGAATVVVCWSVMVWAKILIIWLHLLWRKILQILQPSQVFIIQKINRLLPCRHVSFLLNEQGVERYHAVKAAAWLTYAAHEGSEKVQRLRERRPLPRRK